MDDLAEAIETAAGELPAGWTIQINVENGSAIVDLINDAGDSGESIDGADLTLSEQVLEALRIAKEEAAANG